MGERYYILQNGIFFIDELQNTKEEISWGLSLNKTVIERNNDCFISSIASLSILYHFTKNERFALDNFYRFKKEVLDSLKVNNGCKLLYGDVANWISENNYKNEILLNEVR
ncbi:MAG: hypothetical protein PWQ25_471 [Deferribacteres bacterium]|nr:hypothetical protein [Deferribacteres bacterium]